MTEYQLVPTDAIYRDHNQPRKHFDQTKLEELAASIREHGIIQPIAVSEDGDGRYMLIYGERRWLAAQMVGLRRVPAVVGQPDGTAVDRFILQLEENENQVPLDPIDEAEALDYLLRQGDDGRPISRTALAAMRRRSLPYIDARLSLLGLDEAIQQLVREGNWPVDIRATRAILSIPDATVRIALAEKMANPRVNLKQLTAVCAAAATQTIQAHTAVSANDADNRPFEAAQVLLERGEDVPADTANGRNTRAGWTAVRKAFADVCGDCGWRDTTGVAEPALTIVLEAFGHTCESCTDKMANGKLDTCRDCPAPDALSRIIQGAKRHDS